MSVRITRFSSSPLQRDTLIKRVSFHGRTVMWKISKVLYPNIVYMTTKMDVQCESFE